jgi:hypothetical protein
MYIVMSMIFAVYLSRCSFMASENVKVAALMPISEVICFNMSHSRDSKNYTLVIFLVFVAPLFLSYTRFLAAMPKVIMSLSSYLTTLKGEPTGIEFIAVI